jgi:hypothetical protein
MEKSELYEKQAHLGFQEATATHQKIVKTPPLVTYRRQPPLDAKKPMP